MRKRLILVALVTTSLIAGGQAEAEAEAQVRSISTTLLTFLYLPYTLLYTFLYKEYIWDYELRQVILTNLARLNLQGAGNDYAEGDYGEYSDAFYGK